MSASRMNVRVEKRSISPHASPRNNLRDGTVGLDARRRKCQSHISERMLPRACSRASAPLDQSGDLVGFLADLDFHFEPAADRFNVLSERVDLGSFDVTILDA